MCVRVMCVYECTRVYEYECMCVCVCVCACDVCMSVRVCV